MTYEHVTELELVRSRRVNGKRVVVVMQLQRGSLVHILDASGDFKFQAKVTNLETGKSWVEVTGRGLMLRSFPEDRVIPAKWPSRPKTNTYGIGE